ncbi:unnamed protein product [Effrenium voratum]|uniref:Protein kinase domain-containing protein n=1 Tax=Effrenium voratum TaxID=2562239 RepID=A0AA36ISL1_9DINO|nr:unnamed protein product [Effrenium voratum]
MACCPCVPSKTPSNRVHLDVGGQRFTTARVTLTAGRAAGSKLAELVAGTPEADGVYFLDRDGEMFLHVLNYLRHGPELFVPPESNSSRLSLRNEAKMLQLPELARMMEEEYAPHQYAVFESDVYQGAPIPRNEKERIAKLRSLEVVDTENVNTDFDNITRCVAAILQVPICLVSLVAEDKQWFKSKTGLEADETSRASSFCAYTLLPEALEDSAVLVVTDARRDVRFMRNPLVLGEPYIQFYAGCPLVTSEGLRIGSLCAIDRVPRHPAPSELGLLINFGYLTVQLLEERHLKLDEESEGEGELQWRGGRQRAEAMVDGRKMAVALVWARPDSMDWPLIYANKVWTQLTGVTVVSPCKFPDRAEISAPGAAGSVESFWDHVRMASADPGQVLELWKMVSAAMAPPPGGRDLRQVGFGTSLQAKRGKARLTARFSPAELPLSENAAVVKNHGLEASRERWQRPKGWADGHWCFVQMVQQKEPEKLPPIVVKQEEPLKVKEETVSMKPPTAPFEDVRLLRLVGQGSFGSVYFSLWSGAAVAVKVIKTVVPTGKSEEVAKTPHFEALLSVTISHPNLVQTFKHGGRVIEMNSEEKAVASMHETWIVQEWCDGGTLRANCKMPRNEDVAFLEAMQICIEISRAGQYLHDIGLIHGDLTANNVLLKSMPVAKGYVCKVCDFGLARVLGESKDIITNTLGTVTHMPPELLSVSEKCSLTQKADVYALGIIAYQVITGQQPFAGMSPPQVVIQVARGRRPSLPPIPAAIEQRFTEVFKSTLSAKPQDRPSFNDLVKFLTGLLHDLGGDEGYIVPSEPQLYRQSGSAPSG